MASVLAKRQADAGRVDQHHARLRISAGDATSVDPKRLPGLAASVTYSSRNMAIRRSSASPAPRTPLVYATFACRRTSVKKWGWQKKRSRQQRLPSMRSKRFAQHELAEDRQVEPSLVQAFPQLREPLLIAGKFRFAKARGEPLEERTEFRRCRGSWDKDEPQGSSA